MEEEEEEAGASRRASSSKKLRVYGVVCVIDRSWRRREREREGGRGREVRCCSVDTAYMEV
jgi:hypothetical protein